MGDKTYIVIRAAEEAEAVAAKAVTTITGLVLALVLIVTLAG